MTFLRRLFGLDFPEPAVGQVWRSDHSGRSMRVSELHTTGTGSVFIYVEHEYEPGRWTIGNHYAIGLSQWRCNLRAERRELVAVDQPRPRYAPPPRDLSGARPAEAQSHQQRARDLLEEWQEGLPVGHYNAWCNNAAALLLHFATRAAPAVSPAADPQHEGGK